MTGVKVTEVYVRAETTRIPAVSQAEASLRELAEWNLTKETMWAAVGRAQAADGPPRLEPLTEGRRVRVSALMTGYSHVHVAELMLAGMPVRQAFDLNCLLFYHVFALHWGIARGVATGRQFNRNTFGTMWWPLSENSPYDEHFLQPSEKRPVARCFARAAGENSRILLRDEPEGGEFSAFAEPALADRLSWMLEMMRRFGSGGGSLAQSAQGALDAAAGRPRRRRRPVDEEWLAAEISDALTATWPAIAATVTTLPTQRVTFRSEVNGDAR